MNPYILSILTAVVIVFEVKLALGSKKRVKAISEIRSSCSRQARVERRKGVS